MGEDISRLEKHCYRDNGDRNYIGIMQIENLFDEIDSDYYKPMKTKGAFNNNYIEYEAERIKTKDYLLKHIYIRLCHT